LCDLPIDRSLKHPHAMSPVIDHIKPLSKGGSHTYTNVQAAHMRCNSSKSDSDIKTLPPEHRARLAGLGG
jgi:5-methylcytosine-specific restriction endonuclease McrA